MRFKYLITTLLTLMSMTLTSCGLNVPFIYTNGSLPSTIDRSTIQLNQLTVSINPSTLANMIDQKETMLVYFGDHLCASCLIFEDVLINYIDQTRVLIYHYDTYIYYHEYDSLRINYPEVFTGGLSTPMLLIVDKGQLSARRDAHSSMYEFNSFRSIMTSYIDISKVMFTYDLLHLVDREHRRTLIYFYDRDNEQSNLLWTINLYPQLVKQNKPFYLFDINFANQEILSDLVNIYGYTGQPGYIIKIDEDIISDTIDLLTSTNDQIVDWVNFSL